MYAPEQILMSFVRCNACAMIRSHAGVGSHGTVRCSPIHTSE